MTNGNDAAQAKHRESTALAVKRYVLAEVLNLSSAVAAQVLLVNSRERKT